MSCTFWNMRRRLRKQLGIEREIEEEKVIVDIAAAQKEAKKASPAKKKAKTAKEG